MAAPSSTVSVTGAAPAPRPSDDGVVAYLVEVLSGGATLLQDAPLAVVSEAAGLMQEVPVVGIVCKTYLAFEQLVDTAKSNQGDLATLRDLCRDGITKVLENRKDHPGLLKKNFAKLEEHVLKAEELARRCNGDCTAKKIKRVVFARKISKDIAAIRSDILAFCEVATLALADDTLTLVDNINVKVGNLEAAQTTKRSSEDVLTAMGRELKEQRRIADLASRVKIPPGAPRIRDWYVERKPLVVQACNRLGIGQGGDTPQAPKMVGLAGPSGAGKSTVASMVIARDDVRAYFEKGVLWLQVGQAAKDRLPELKSRLADMVYESVMQKACRPPRKQEDLASDPEDGVEYIVDVMNKDMMRFLVVADDVWDVEVLEALKRAGAWVLYTTRHRDLLPEPPRPLRVDQMLKEEAELVLRRAADLHDDAYLPNAAYELMERCDYAASDLAFVGRWSDVRGRSGHDGQAWQAVLNRIMEEAKRSGEDGQLLSWRAAVLHAGLDELACENPKNKELYLSLAILPNGLAFSSEVAAVLLYGSGFSAWDLEAAEGVVMTLERLSILTLEDGGSYRVHDEHADFIQGRGVANQDIWDRVLCRWREYMSSSRALFAFSTHWLVVIWEVLACAEGTGLVSRPYDPALDAMDPTGSDIAKALKKGAYFHWLREEWSEVYSKSSRLLEIQENGDRGNSLDVARVLNALGVCAGKAGRTQEAEELFRRALAILEDKLGVDHPGVANTLNILGLYAFESGKMEEAEKSYRRALAVQQDNLGIDHADVADTLDNLGVCAHESGKTEEAEELYRRSLAIREARLGFDHPDVADTLCSLGMCAGNVGRMEEAEKLYQRALSIQENKLGVDHPDLADILDNLGACAHEAGRMEKAEELYQRVLAIREEKLGVDHPDVASTLDKLGLCVGKTGRAKEGEGLFRRALAIREGTLGTE